MAYVDAELASQPECWRRAVHLAARSTNALPRPGERVAAVGCGTSWFMAMAYAARREQAGQGETERGRDPDAPRHLTRSVVLP